MSQKPERYLSHVRNGPPGCSLILVRPLSSAFLERGGFLFSLLFVFARSLAIVGIAAGPLKVAPIMTVLKPPPLPG